MSKILMKRELERDRKILSFAGNARWDSFKSLTNENYPGIGKKARKVSLFVVKRSWRKFIGRVGQVVSLAGCKPVAECCGGSIPSSPTKRFRSAVVSTSPCHGGNKGSSPFGTANKKISR